jgi:hypothetical protein
MVALYFGGRGDLDRCLWEIDQLGPPTEIGSSRGAIALAGPVLGVNVQVSIIGQGMLTVLEDT